MMPREERVRPLPTAHIVAMFGALILLVVAVLFLHGVVSDQWGRPVLRVLRHPVIIVPLWAVMVLFAVETWKNRDTCGPTAIGM